jgi:hypothetical protein
MIKTDASGNEMWSKTIGSPENDSAFSVQQTDDDGFIIAGVTSSFGMGGRDVYLIKTDASGSEMWSKTFGGADQDYGYSVQQTDDSGFIIAGRTLSFGDGDGDAYLIKTDASGNELWSQTFGGAKDDNGYSVQQTKDGGFIIAGSTHSFGAGGWDVYLIYFKPLPEPDIKANGEDALLNVIPTENVNITIALDPGQMNGKWLDWWIGVISSYGTIPFIGQPIPLFELPESTLLDIPLPIGMWVFYFILDNSPNGIFDSVTWYDYVVVISSAQVLDHRGEALRDFDSIFQEKIDEIMRK